MFEDVKLFFQCKKGLINFFIYTGPALIVSVAYMDPGNFGTAIQAGASVGYSLLWVVWLSSGMAMLLQYLSGKLGIATGKSLPEIIREKLNKKTIIIPYWLAAETAALATDLAEYLGTVIALNLLFGIPLLHAAIFGALDVILILIAIRNKFRILEQIFVLFVSIIGFGFLYELFIAKPDFSSILIHSINPMFASSDAILLSVGIIGATVMPHALFLHSWLTSKKLDKHTIEEKQKLRKLHLLENVIVLTVAAMVNAAIMIMSAAAFSADYSSVQTISDAYMILIPLFGTAAGIVFIITLLSSGISSSVVGTLAGQVIMEGLLGLKVNLWTRRIITRFINVVPTTIAILLGMDPLSILVYSQVILSLMIPLPIIPLIVITGSKKTMGEFVNKNITTVISILFAGIILVFNSYLLLSTIIHIQVY
ncbi:Nramp family divalent metal transporter [Candidatus Nitrosocosmicus sp. SS]|uniref:Nramp family divalent metal transporter n=1 Tax=Candidatus Nitrosocosmicus agrestis TaxID=2563600 RepID=UPI0013313E89|nr:Nramp family divalent metal transporter [Candidatus Nitrosocosmicus sp. SS]